MLLLLALGWTRTITNLLDLDLDCKSPQKFRFTTGFGLTYWERLVAFSLLKNCFVHFLDLTF